MTEQRFCPQCGAQRSPGAGFCAFCGLAVAPPGATVSPVPPAPAAAPAPAPPPATPGPVAWATPPVAPVTPAAPIRPPVATPAQPAIVWAAPPPEVTGDIGPSRVTERPLGVTVLAILAAVGGAP